ncbi:MAG: ferrous iron transport protein B [Ruminococcaceae bacterium]|nr:ferrous iron transport protein B [Oscillospiraceae bacterium]
MYNKPKEDKLILLAGNPNVGKSTVFNALTGLRQHTGNWTGKTVMSAIGTYESKGRKYTIADIPGCYSLKAHSTEERCAADAISFGNSDGVVVICNAFNLERNLNLVLQICEAHKNVAVCINMSDEAEKSGIFVNCKILEESLGIPVRKINARKKKGLENVVSAFNENKNNKPLKVSYSKNIEYAIHMIEKVFKKTFPKSDNRYMALRFLEGDSDTEKKIMSFYESKSDTAEIFSVRKKTLEFLENNGITQSKLRESVAITLDKTAERICKMAVLEKDDKKNRAQTLTDRILTGKISGFLIMILLLGCIFYITLIGANNISDYLAKILFSFEKPLIYTFEFLHFPKMLTDVIVNGGYKVLSWVISVMLPPMAIFFPLFTILEDVGYLPRVAFNLDRAFKKCKSCGKQALTTCMAFGCNAAAVSGARIIDSPRERLIAILTNAFIPCNGRFPALICLISAFLPLGFLSFGASALYLTAFVVFSVLMSLFASWVLSKTLLKGIPSSFALELPSFRKPQIGQIIVRSLLSRTIFVLARAAVVAFPAGIVLWLVVNIKVSGTSLINYMISFLDPLGKLMGMDGTMLASFILGIPANEIVLPIALMIYSSGSVLTSFESSRGILEILSNNGWTVTTAVCVIFFFIMHWPCSTTLMTVKKETDSFLWAFVSFLLPTLFGILFCMALNFVISVF